MKKSVRMIALVTCLLLLLSGCGQGTFSPKEEIVIVPPFSYAPVVLEHTGDYVIQWEDAGMEAHIRLLLDKPEGDILHSDVRDIQVLRIAFNAAEPRDLAMTEPADGAETFSFQSTQTSDSLPWVLHGKTTLPPVESLRDLRHFDSLQILDLGFKIVDHLRLDLSGLEECKYLKDIDISNAGIESLAPLAELSELERLSLRYCGQLDLTPLEGLPSLVHLGAEESEILSLEPLTQIPSLLSLYLGESTFPSLEPLTRTTVQELDMLLSLHARDMYKDLDYEPISRMPNLLCLDLTNHAYVDVEICETILKNCDTLIFLDVTQTKAGQKLKWGLAKLDVSNLEGFRY